MADVQKKLLFVIGAQTKDFNRAIGDMERQVKNSFGNINKALGGLLPALSVATVVAGFTDMMNTAANYGEEMLLAAQKTGLTTDMLQDLNYLAKTTNSSLAGLETGLKKMNIAISDGLSGNSAAVENFKQLGLSIESLSTMNTDQRFMAIAKAIAAIPDQADRVKAVVDMFGKAGADLLPLIESLHEIENMKPPKLTKEELQSLADAKESIEKLDNAWLIFQGRLAATMFPSFNPWINDMNTAVGVMEKLLGWWNQLPFAVKAIIQAPATFGGSLIFPALKESGITARASGGIVTSPELALVGEAGPEAIIPLSQMGGLGGNSVTVNVGNYMGDEISKRALVRDIQRILNEENRRSTHKPTETNYYSVGGHL
jgi:hypothetical protein